MTEQSPFSTDEQKALLDFWHTYQEHYRFIQAQTMKAVAAHLEFGPMLRAITPEQLEEQNRASRELLERAITKGQWAEHDENSRIQGAIYAQMGISFRGWYDMVRSFEHPLVTKLVETYHGQPERLSSVLLAFHKYLDRSMAFLAESYMEAKDSIIRENQKQAEDVRLRSVELEAENRRVQEANRLKSEFLANMSHELRTPLNAIIGFTELLHDGEVKPDTPQFMEFLGDILTSGHHLLQLINDVLDLAKVEAGKLTFNPEAVDLAQVVGEVVTILRSTAVARRIRVESTVSPDLGHVEVDVGRLKQVLYNYISNALKFTPENGRVGVSVKADSATMFRLEVEDNGIGIPPEDLGRLFVEFQQLDAGRAKKHAGTGLGLALTKRLVEAQGGSVGVTSTLGQGSIFYAVLPQRTAAPDSASPPIAVPCIRPGAPTILVIEDDDHDQKMLVDTLVAAGFGVELAKTGGQALAKCHEQVFDAITLDLLLPDMNGFDILRTIRAETKNRDVPIIVVTMVSEKGVISGFAVHDTLPKPLDGAALLQSLARAGVLPDGAGHVLVVDDDPSSLKLMTVTLSQLGFRSLCANTGKQGLDEARARPPLAVILDLLMPEMDGFAFLDHFRTLPRCDQVPVIIWTVKDLDVNEGARLRATAQALITKGGDGRLALVEQLRTLLTWVSTPKG